MNRLLAVLMISVSFLAGCSTLRMTSSPVKESKEKSLVLLHGSHFDGDLWKTIKPMLSGPYDIFTPTILGRNQAEHANLTEMAQDICSKIVGPSIIVAHSFAGAVVNQMAGICPNRIDRIIYVAAVIPLANERAMDLYSQKDQRAYEKLVSFDKDRMTPQAPKSFFKAMDASLDPKTLPKVTLYSESYGPSQDRVSNSPVAFNKIPKFYIYTSLDRIIGIETQQKQTARVPMIKTETIESGHLPMLSKPQELATIIRDLMK